MLEGYVSYLGGLWAYPYYSTSIYFTIAIACGGFGFYFLSIITSYHCIKILLDKAKKGVTAHYRPSLYEKYIFSTLFILGTVGLLYSFVKIAYGTAFLRMFTFNITTLKPPYIQFSVIIIAFFSFWFISEYIEFIRHRSSLLHDVIHGYLNPLIAVFIASIILLFYMEIQNLPIKLWVYSYQPLNGVQIFDLPLWIYIGWPLHYIAFISLYRALGNKPSAMLLDGDEIP